ncbi:MULTISPECIES: chemoreceptor glutamine deamidase CheD [unclassified Variovorax]|jgi:chemotaxis protein CheD|uniref:chemoreceptor glutamine deamidase CheD n=1 Tax=unclassified Variovorax TaxID=663243 RepID=UPI000F7D6870|nr:MULTISPECIES: chemoreceptor glutamine deamidase CheD [unclassified Variovorax]RSZ47287.1 chemoreceptor glutamine deamidase CheD [Variovorax sp. 553]RSZ48590.1 chemoreceptor glutamine deamidase CheD [Variovorax sp. 679]
MTDPNAAAPESVASHHYFDRDVGLMAVKLLPSEYYVTSSNTALSTVLGSCVAACLHDREAGVAGMNHFMLPDDGESGAGAGTRDAAESMRYGAYAMDVLIRELVRAGARRERLRAKVFGGGAVLANMTTLNIGDRNADFVLRYLRDERIEVAAQDLRGPHARRVCFVPATGKAIVRKLRAQTEVRQVQHEEGELLRRLSGSRVAPAVENKGNQ